MSATDTTTSDVPESLPEPNIIPLQRAPIDDEPPLPDHLRDGNYEELGSEVNWEWDPITRWESTEAVLINKTAMKLGGTAYTLAIDTGQPGKELPLVLLKKGGRILDACMLDVNLGDRFYIRFRGLLPAKPNQNPARNWRVLKSKPV